MNILHVIDSMDPSHGGTSQAVRNIVPSLEKLGVASEVVCLDDPNAPFLKKDLFHSHAIGRSSGPWRYSSQLGGWLTKNLLRYDVVIIHGLWLYHGYATSRAIRKLKNHGSRSPKLFVMPHGMLDPYFQRAPERKLKAIRNRIYWQLIEADVINRADGILFTCQAELILAREPFRPYRPKRESNVGFGIEPPPARADSMFSAFLKKCPQLKGQRYLLFISRIHEKKGVDLLITAYSKIAGDRAPRLVIAGPGLESEYGQNIQRMVADKNISAFVFFPGMLSGDEKWGSFYNCEAFVLPSHQENFGIAVVESLACSKPVLISNKVNIWHEIETAGGGIVADDTIEGTCQTLKRWMNLSSEERAAMGDHARKAYQKNFAIDPVAHRIIEALNA
jgi:glycosyltransferase involved in cell wall biosynthesis